MKASLGLVSAAITISGALASIYVAGKPGLTVFDLHRGAIFVGTVGTTAFGALLGFIATIHYKREHGSGALGVVSMVAAVFGAIGSILAGMGSTRQYDHGRPFRRRGVKRLAKTETSGRWLDDQESLASVPSELREGLAAEWRSNGAKEHASIAAFSRLSLDLLALGAPPALLAEVQSDALDEIRHAQLCFSIARDLDGRIEGPSDFPEAREPSRTLPTRTLALTKLAIDAVVDGALNEGVSARILARLSLTTTHPRLAEVLRGMAADEARHAAHSWNIVAFCIESGGAPVVHALRGALGALPKVMTAPLPEAARDGSWEAYGVQGLSLETEAWSGARKHAVSKLEALLDGRAQARTRKSEASAGVRFMRST